MREDDFKFSVWLCWKDLRCDILREKAKIAHFRWKNEQYRAKSGFNADGDYA